MATTSDTRNPEEIERDIRQTQAEMSRTVDQLGDQLTPRNLFNSLLDKADENGVDARYLLDGARRNPIALAMIAIGGIWLVSDSDAKASTLTSGLGGSGSSKGRSSRSGSSGSSDLSDDYHVGYIEHMSRCEPRSDEDDLAYRRRRDLARANYLMIEQRHDEDEHSFRRRLDEATEGLRQRRERVFESARNSGRSAVDASGRAVHAVGSAGGSAMRTVGDAGSRAASAASSAYGDNPLLGGLAAALVGAVIGAAVPLTRTEEEQLGEIGESALQTAKEKARAVGEQVREKKDQFVDQADQRLNESGGGSGGAPGSSAGEPQVDRSNPELSAI
jgi:hypothetical protein